MSSLLASPKDEYNTVDDGFSRTSGHAHSKTLAGSLRQQQVPDYNSPARSLFKQNKETLDQMLVRKLRQKYIDDNPVFSVPAPVDDTTALLHNNFFSNLSKSSTRSRRSNVAETYLKQSRQISLR